MKPKSIKLTKNLTLFFINTYPFCNTKIDNKKYTVTLSLGGNMGDNIKRFVELFKYIKNDTRFTITKSSPILRNPPFGYLEQDYFYNCILEVKTNLPPLYLLKITQRYEKKFKRRRLFKDAPRTLDIDIIFIQKYNQKIEVSNRDLVVPHKNWQNRESVTIPLNILKKRDKK